MKTKLLFAFATLLFVACGNKVAQPEAAEDVNLPEYKLVSADEPRVSGSGHISPGQNLVYNIEINSPLQRDSLELLQDYFINKGKEAFPGINKIIVRVYLKGTASPGLPPYASLVLIGDNKEIEINEDANKVAEAIENQEEPKSETTKVQEKKDVFVGRYFCSRTHDTYIFNSDNTGLFVVQGCPPSNFTWKRSGNNVTVTHEYFGNEKLKYDPRKETLTEQSESFGTLVFDKR
jgi:hypothetical protein